tara:strand:+ start:354 stop:587 length:234 start_codon:yes stop_codon:yes gene_type:complete
MAPESYTLTPSGPLGGLISVSIVEGSYVGEFPDTESALQAISERMDREQFWPDIYWVSDHGNVWPIDLMGRELVPSE